MTRLAFEHVACTRGGRMLFEGLSFDLRDGDALLVTGPNGAGKSSLLRVAAGLIEARAGLVHRDGPIALADEHPALDRELPLARALGFWAAIDGGDVGAALSAVALAHLAEVPVRMLSSGQLRRATLARVVASRAGIWLLDEPANGLDAAAITRLESVIAAHRACGGIAVVASHLAMSLEHARTLELAPLHRHGS